MYLLHESQASEKPPVQAALKGSDLASLQVIASHAKGPTAESNKQAFAWRVAAWICYDVEMESELSALQYLMPAKDIAEALYMGQDLVHAIQKSIREAPVTELQSRYLDLVDKYNSMEGFNPSEAEPARPHPR